MTAINRTQARSNRALGRPRVESTTVSLAVVVISTALMLEAMRVLISYLVVVVGQANRSALVQDTLAVFIATAVAPLVIRLIGARATAIFTASSIAILRIVLQFWTQPNARLFLAAAVVILWGWLIIALLGAARDAVALGLLAGLVLDVAVRAALLSLDLPWNTGLAPGVVTVALAILLLAGATGASGMDEARVSARGLSLSLVGVGPGLAIFHLVGGNLGLIQTKTGLGFAEATTVLAVGLAAGVAGSVLLERESMRQSLWMNLLERAMVVVIGGAALWLLWTNETMAPFALPFVAAANLMLIGASIWSGIDPDETPHPITPTIWFTLGMLLQVGILFLYYDASGRTLYMVSAAILLAAGALIGALVPVIAQGRRQLPAQAFTVVAAPVLILAIVCGWQLAGESNPSPGSPLPGTFTVMTYNLQDGFAADNSFDLEAQAETIAAAHPDVIVLQEVSRGWLVTSGADEALWLSHRLDMPIYFGGNSDDGLWGNAILTRAPVADVQQLHFTVTKNLKRGTIEARVPTDAGDVWVVGTHLDNPKAADAIRLEQTNQLIANLRGRTPAVVMGDLNADPATDVLNTFGAAGLADPGVTYLSGVTTTTDERRLDYVLVSDGFRVESMQAIDSPAADHKPVMATLTLTSR